MIETHAMQSFGVLVACAALWTASGLKIGAFNVQVFGSTKLQDEATMDVLSKVSRYVHIEAEAP